MAMTADDVGDSAIGWAIWKALDWATARLLEPAAGGARPAQDLDREALFAAVRQLSDERSALVQSLARVLGRQYETPQARDLALDHEMAQHSREEGLVLAAVVLYADSQARSLAT